MYYARFITAPKKRAQLINNYEHAKANNLFNAYKTRCSDEKLSEERYILREMQELDGEEYRVCTASSYAFTCAFTYTHINEETGEVTKRLRYYTKDHTFECEL